ncbi:unnamed protein product [Rotaria sordida]|uniref:Uncharacterized protein n=1 Tax=Rotaria sordida TaxID=392033 RepID=A0A814JJV5_9BILA|nr:unnamed protein product [Rotaria sordida]
MITEKQVEHVIIPMPHEHFVVLTPNIIIIFLTIILIVFYIRQSTNIRQRIADRQHDFNDIHSTLSLPNVLSNTYQGSLSNRSQSLMTF